MPSKYIVHEHFSDVAQVRSRASLDHETAVQGLQSLGVDHLGLEQLDRDILRALIEYRTEAS